MRSLRFVILSLALLAFPQLLQAGTITINFEGLNSLEPVSSQFPGLTFSNATILTAGLSLDEFEFPPHSGVNVVFDDGGSISINFAVPVTSFGGYFTYATPVTLSAWDVFNNPLTPATSLSSSNLLLSGDPGSSPNEFLGVSFSGGISQVTITGDPAGGSFTLDDVTLTTGSTMIPEPSTLVLVLLGGILTFAVRRRTHN
jgi:hypothetical protein